MNTTKHTASGQAAGYLFQPDRALFWLAHSPKGSVIGIETADDVTVVSESGEVIIREQDKNSIQENGKPIKDRSNDLWNTLYIWTKGLERNEFSVDKARLFFATNKAIPDDSLVRKIANTDAATIDSLIPVLKTAINNPPDGLRDKVEYVLNRETLLREIIPIIELSDNSSPDNLNKDVISELHLPEEIAQDVIIHVKGWIHDSITLLWDDNKPGFLERDAFDNFLNNAKYKFSSSRIKERVKRLVLIDVDPEKRAKSEEGVFVKQLEAISNDSDLIVEAIDDFLCADIERTNLILAGEITRDDFKDFDDKCETRWKEVRRRHNRDVNLAIIDEDVTPEEKENKLQEIGFSIYDQTACNGYCGILASYQTTEPYLTKGTFYILSDALTIGWHPQWKEKFIEDENG